VASADGPKFFAGAMSSAHESIKFTVDALARRYD
jgi:hypothetical protein